MRFLLKMCLVTIPDSPAPPEQPRCRRVNPVEQFGGPIRPPEPLIGIDTQTFLIQHEPNVPSLPSANQQRLVSKDTNPGRLRNQEPGRPAP